MRSRLLPELVADHAGFFKVAGDMNAYLYTSSRAMHSGILNLLSGQVRAPEGHVRVRPGYRACSERSVCCFLSLRCRGLECMAAC